MTLTRFVDMWTSSAYAPESVSDAELSDVERRLGIGFPADYRQAVLEVGLPRPTTALLDAIVERELDLDSVGDFYSPAEIGEETTAWREMGMPDRLVAFASDGCGNMFCFDTAPEDGASAPGQAVWLYDHDFESVKQVAASFSDWIEAFCRVEPVTL